MDFDSLSQAARARLETASWAYYRSVAAGDPDRDQRAWEEIDVIPRVLRGLTGVDCSLVLAGTPLNTPIVIAPTASHVLAHPDGEHATARAAGATGALMVYSSSAAVEITEFAAAATGPWWAQVYVMKDRSLTDDYLARVRTAGASAVVLTVDNVGTFGDAPFRHKTRALISALPGNYPGLTWAEMSAQIEPALEPQVIDEIASATGLPVHVKGVMHPDDAVLAVAAGAAGIVVSNHGRRQVAGVAPVATVLAEIVAAVGGQVPVTVDGGIRSGVDVLRALALGATAVGVGRPVLWGLAAGGSAGVVDVLSGLTNELRQAMASAGAADLSAIDRSMVRTPGR